MTKLDVIEKRNYKTHLFSEFCFVDSVEDDTLKQTEINRSILITINIFNFCYIHILLGQFHISSGNADIDNIANI